MQNISASTSLMAQQMSRPTPSLAQSNFVATQECWSHKQQVFSYASQPQPLPVFWHTVIFLSSVKEIKDGQNLVAYMVSSLILEISY